MAYNLTPNQKGFLNWLVQKTREGKLPGEILVVIHKPGIIQILDYISNEKVPTITASDLYALEKNELIILNEKSKVSWKCSLLQSGYDAVDSNFVQPPNPPSSLSIANDFQGANIGTYQSIGMAYNSPVSQSANDPAVFIDGLTAVCRDLVTIVGNQLDKANDRTAYNLALRQLQNEAASSNPDHSLIRKLLGTLSLTADVYANYELIALALPLVNGIAQLLAARFGGS